DPMNQQMKMMQLISPIMVLFFGWNYAAGLALYWTVSSIFAMFQQYFVTGWGSLLVTPSFLSSKAGSSVNGNSKNATKNRSKDTTILDKTKEQPETDNVVESDAVGSKLQTRTYGSGSSSARRRNASARR